jgi:hypothetical protein
VRFPFLSLLSLLSSLLAGCARGTPIASPGLGPTSAFVRALVIDVPVEGRPALDGRDACGIATDPRVAVLASPAIAALEGQVGRIAIGAPGTDFEFTVHPQAVDASRMRFELSVDVEGHVQHVNRVLESQETVLVDTDLPAPVGHVIVLLIHPVIHRADEPEHQTPAPLAADPTAFDGMCWMPHPSVAP